MKKQWNKNLFKAVLLSVLAVLMIGATLAVVSANGDEVRELTVVLDDNVQSCLIEIKEQNGTEWSRLDSFSTDKTVSVPYNYSVRLTITPNAGKWATFTVEGGSSYVSSPETQYIQWTSYKEPCTVSVSCIDRIYSIVALNDDRSSVNFPHEVPRYNLVSGSSLSLEQLFNKTLKYQFGMETLTELPTVEREDHVFGGWYIVMGEGANDVKLIQPDPSTGKCLLPNNLTLNDYHDLSGVLNVYPCMIPVTYDVYREDWVYDPNTSGNRGEKLDNATYQQAIVNSIISALEKNFWIDDPADAYKTYKGYLLRTDLNGQHTVGEPPETNTHYNTVYRYFDPIVYELVYYKTAAHDLFTAEEYSPDYTTYTYSNPTTINAPTRKGYTFTGWTVEIYDAELGEWKTVGGATQPSFTIGNENAGYNDQGRYDGNAIYASDAQENGKYQIRLIANWTPNTYSITYNWNVPAELADLMETLTENALLLSGYTQVTFDQLDAEGAKILAIPAPVRPGYTFDGWTLQVEGGETPDPLVMKDGFLQLPTDRYAANLTLVANWEREEYFVVFDGAGATTAPDATVRPSVKYDLYLEMSEEELALIVPARTGHTFKGYYSEPGGLGTQYIAYNDGKATLTGAIWTVDGENGAAVTLYAHWEVNDYEISVNVGGLTDPDALSGIVITITPESGSPFTVDINGIFELPYGTRFTVTIQSPDGYKIVAFDGSEMLPGHRKEFSFTDMTVGAWDTGCKTFTATVYPMRELELTQSNVNYPAEKLHNLPTGKYIVYGENGDELATFRINAQSLTYDISKWFTTESRFVSVVYCGENGYSDSDPLVLELKGRPSAPSYVKEGVGEIMVITPSTYGIIIEMATSAKGRYEFACVEVGVDAAIQYTPGFAFTDLKPGTRYKIYIRCAATESEPHGVEFSDIYFTFTVDYFDSIKNELEQLKGENPGPITSELIDKALQEIEKLGQTVPNDPNGTNNYYQTVQTIIQTIKEQELQIAIAKDRAILDLTKFRDDALASDSFTKEKAEELKALCDNAIASIKEAASVEDVEKLYSSALLAMKNVPVHNLTDSEKLIFVQSALGLDQESALTLIRDVDFEVLSRLVNEAIRTSGKVAVGSFMTQEEAENLLRALEVVASYRFELSNSDQIREGDVFTVRLTIPENLRSMTGLQVAYYDDATGVIELLKSYVDGDCLVFEATRITDFVILADPTVELTGVIIALGAILFFQILAIAIILVSRVRAKKTVTHAGIAFPAAFLTVHFLPVNGEWIALIMAAAVVVLQIVLMALLLSSGVVHLPKRRKKNALEYEGGEEDTSPYAEIDPSLAYADTAAEASGENEANDTADVEADFGMAAILMNADEMSDEDPFMMYGDAEDEAFDSKDFIEPAATTRYSLPDEEFAAFDSDGEVDAYAEIFAEDEAEEYADDADVAEESDEAFYAEEEYAEEAYADVDAAEEEYVDEVVYGDGFADEEALLDPEDAYDTNAAYGEEIYDGELPETESEDEALEEEELLEEDLYFAPAEEETDDTDPMYRYDE